MPQIKCASGSVGGVRPCQGRGRGFESRLALSRVQERVSEMDTLSCAVQALPGSNVRGLRSAPVVAKRTSTGRSATSRALLKSVPKPLFIRVSAFSYIKPIV